MKKTEAKKPSVEDLGQKTGKNSYNPSAIEPKWQAVWEKEKIYQPDLQTANGSASHSTLRDKPSGSDSKSSPLRPPFYNLMMFPYPSAEGLHVGSMYTFSGVDVYGRFKRMQGYDVFEPIGLDGFGIHSENHAIKMGTHPIEHARTTEKTFYRQLREIGNGFAWEQKLETYDPKYYKWTQWLFIELFKMGLAYRKKAPVNFCPSCKTVLADEQVVKEMRNEKGERRNVEVCERCGTEIEMKDLEQWFFKITDYADRLLNNIDSLNWTEKIKTAQREWIGRSEGARIEFKVKSSKFKIEVFTTAIDTIYGVTFMVISPEHLLIPEILKLITDEKKVEEIQKYIQKAKNKSDIERQGEGKEKTGVPTGLFVINPFNNEAIPLWVADYVLAGYGTGAVMGVPGHDARDHEFAKKFGLPIKPVVKPKAGVKEAKVEKDGFWDYPEIKKFADKSVLFDSGEFNGLTSAEAKSKMLEFIKDQGFGEKKTTYHLRDWLISRQRYWGPPIPMIYCENCAKSGKGQQKDMPGWFPVPEKDLPVELPDIKDFKPLGTGKAPLANHPEFYETKCPNCGSDAVRETDVSDTFLDSSWYFFRYLSPDLESQPFDKLRARKWLPVTMYIGGAEHAVMHLLYSRFIWKVLIDLGYIDFSAKGGPASGWEEPFARFYAHGLIIKDGAKMSKSKGNVVNPDIYIKKYGADTLRTYLRFLGPFDQTGDFRDSGVEGMNRFLKKVWKLIAEKTQTRLLAPERSDGGQVNTPKSAEKGVDQRLDQQRSAMMHKTIKSITEEMEALRFNTSIAHLMSWYNFLSKQESVSQEEAEAYLKLLAPFAPHMTEELFQEMRNERGEMRNKKDFKSIHTSMWPTFDEKYLVSDTVKIPVQVNGKFRSTLEVASSDIDNKNKIEDLAKKDEKVAKFLEGHKVKQAIYVEGKVLNFVV